MSELLWITILAGAGWVAWRGRQAGVAAICAGLAVLLVIKLVRPVGAWLITAGLLPVAALAVLAGAAAIGWYRFTHSRAVVTRWGSSLRRKAGVASTWDILRAGSWVAMRRQATTVRPSLGELTRWERVRRPTTEIAIPLCRVGLIRVWATIEEVVLLFGGPRSGKSGLLAGRIVDAPGAVLVTSTRTDLHDNTAELRRARGPVHVFNPTGLGGLASTISFDPVSGCTDPVVAGERAEDMLPGGLDSEHGYWVDQARRALAALLHAAALGGLAMQAIAGWMAAPDTSKEEVVRLLRRSPDPSKAFAVFAEQFLGTNDRTRSSITSTMTSATAWLSSPAAVAATTGENQLDVGELLRTNATVYLLGARAAHAPLVAALTGHIAREARRIAAFQPGGRLDSVLTLVLDEAALVCPVPLDDWSTDMGGRGVHIVAAFQSRAQLIARWGAQGAAIIGTNAGAVVLFGGARDRDDLLYWSTLIGHRDDLVATTGQNGQITGHSVRQVDVLSPAQLAGLRPRRVVVIRRHMPAAIGRAAMVWDRRDYRDQQRRKRAAQRAVVTAAEQAIGLPAGIERARRRYDQLVGRARRLATSPFTSRRARRTIAGARRRAQSRGTL